MLETVAHTEKVDRNSQLFERRCKGHRTALAKNQTEPCLSARGLSTARLQANISLTIIIPNKNNLLSICSTLYFSEQMAFWAECDWERGGFLTTSGL